MSKDKSTSTQDTTQTQTRTASPEETEINKLALERERARQGGLIDSDRNALALSNQFMTGQELPGYFKGLPYGISPEVTTGIVGSSLRDMNTQLAKSGAGSFLESGAAQSMGTRTAGDIRMGAEQFNLGQLLNLLNLATGSSAQIQQPMNANAQMFSSRLGGLGTVTGTTQGSTTNKSMNPFLKSFQTSAGSTLGSPNVGFGGVRPGGIGFGS
jgi:hypothetical protein